MKEDIVFILDSAHGIDVSGKRSPVLPDNFEWIEQPEIDTNKQFREYLWSRQIVERLEIELKRRGLQVRLTNPSNYEIGLRTRRESANAIASRYDHALFISFHCNAAGMGDVFMNARGFCIYTTRGETKADAYATKLFNMFNDVFPNVKQRSDYSDDDPDYESNFAVLLCRPPAMLIETMFQDNIADLNVICSPEFKDKFIKLIADFCEGVAETF